MICLLILNSIFRVFITAILAYKLVAFRDQLKPVERWGMGIAGGSAFLTIPAIWDLPGNPFDKWATTLFSFGIMLYFIGRMTRHFRHARNNTLANKAAARHFEARR